MNKFLFILLLFTGFSISQYSTAQDVSSGIQFRNNNLEELYSFSKTEKKIIFIDIYATWCGPCKMMEKQIFTKDSIAKFYNDNFICTKIDIEKGEGKTIETKFQIESLPTFLFLDQNGNEVHKHVGSLDAKGFMELGRLALNPEKRMSTFRDLYFSDKKNVSNLYRYATALKKERLPADDVVTEYLNQLPDSALLNPENLKLVIEFIDRDSSRFFNYILKNQTTIKKVYNSEDIDYYIFKIYYYQMKSLFKDKKIDRSKYLYYAKAIKPYAINPLTKRALLVNDIRYYEYTKDKDNYVRQCQLYIDSFSVTSRELSHMAYIISEQYDSDKAYMDLAEKWAEKSFKLERSSRNAYVYAEILYKHEAFGESKKYAMLSSELSKSKTPDKRVDKLLKKINKKL